MVSLALKSDTKHGALVSGSVREGRREPLGNGTLLDGTGRSLVYYDSADRQ